MWDWWLIEGDGLPWFALRRRIVGRSRRRWSPPPPQERVDRPREERRVEAFTNHERFDFSLESLIRLRGYHRSSTHVCPMGWHVSARTGPHGHASTTTRIDQIIFKCLIKKQKKRNNVLCLVAKKLLCPYDDCNVLKFILNKENAKNTINPVLHIQEFKIETLFCSPCLESLH